MTALQLSEFDLVILDIDGVLMLDDGPAPGAVRAVRSLRDRGKRVRFLTNDALNSRSDRLSELRVAGFDALDQELFTACSITAELLRRGEPRRVQLLMAGNGRQDFAGLTLVDRDADVVVVGDVFDGYSREAVQAAYTAIRGGAEFIAMQRNRYTWGGGTSRIDVGFWVAGLEFCTGRTARVIGKPSQDCYLLVVHDADCEPGRAVMVSDDVPSDLRGAREAGLYTVHVGGSTEGYSAQEHVDVAVADLHAWVQECIDDGGASPPCQPNR